MQDNTANTEARRDAPAQSVPDSAARDRVEGTMQQAGGRVKESVGALTGNQSMKVEGEGEQLSGAARRTKGTLKDRIKAWIDRR